MKVLYVAGEIAPFSETTETARLIRVLPEAVQEAGGVETRIMMPRYGVVSERRNRLHEVIRLSGAEIHAGSEKDTLHVKVASIPGIRLQVYFMDSVRFFKRKGLHRDVKTGEVFPDNAARALFFARAAISTARQLGWAPDIIHASGWIAGFVPVLLRTELAGDPLFAGAKALYTPDVTDTEVRVTKEQAAAFELPAAIAGKDLREIGMAWADGVAFAPGDPLAKSRSKSRPTGPTLSGTKEQVAGPVLELYTALAGRRELAA
ncbi:MAG TPA: glycogen/starch synthase [Rubricoccaceae bacterium]|nr:glycogen/starch synthase [Rubricoccaceae bacterium]